MPNTSKIPDIVIASGATLSNIVSADGIYEAAIGIMIYAPATLPETTVIEVTDAIPPVAGSVWRVLQDDTAVDIAGPLAGKARLYMKLVFANGFRLKANGATAAARTFAASVVE